MKNNRVGQVWRTYDAQYIVLVLSSKLKFGTHYTHNVVHLANAAGKKVIWSEDAGRVWEGNVDLVRVT